MSRFFDVFIREIHIGDEIAFNRGIICKRDCYGLEISNDFCIGRVIRLEDNTGLVVIEYRDVNGKDCTTKEHPRNCVKNKK